MGRGEKLGVCEERGMRGLRGDRETKAEGEGKAATWKCMACGGEGFWVVGRKGRVAGSTVDC